MSSVNGQSLWLSDRCTLLYCRKAPLVVGIDQVDAVPCLTINKKELMHITCHGKTTEPSKQCKNYSFDIIHTVQWGIHSVGATTCTLRQMSVAC